MATILITGANRGIGLEFCRQYLPVGHTIYACCRNPANAEKLQNLKINYSQAFNILPLDLTSAKSIHGLKDFLQEIPLDILINNAGIYGPYNAENHIDMSSWHQFFQINSIGPYLIIETLLKNIQSSALKKVINISSDMGSISMATNAINIPYRASKAALNAMTKALAMLHAAHHLTFIAMHPGWVRTDMGGPHGTLAVEESVAAMIKQIERFKVEDSGKYYAFNGNELSW